MYDINDYPTKEQWQEGSNLPTSTNFTDGQNYGEMPCPFLAIVTAWQEFKEDGKTIKTSTILPEGLNVQVGGSKIIIQEQCSELRWNSKTGIVIGKNSAGKFVPINYKGNSLGVLPVTKNNNETIIISPKGPMSNDDETIYYNTQLDYQFWYY